MTGQQIHKFTRLPVRSVSCDIDECPMKREEAKHVG